VVREGPLAAYLQGLDRLTEGPLRVERGGSAEGLGNRRSGREAAVEGWHADVRSKLEFGCNQAVLHSPSPDGALGSRSTER
jgi:hypothetical protein